MSNPFESIVELYTESVKKADAAGLAEVYRQATEVVFEGLKERFPFGLNITDVEYLDGYFIFGHGTNSVVHFHIEETPGWKYGIWWSPVTKSEDEDNEANQEYFTDRLRGEFFAQYEEEIDKFKPSASMVSETFTLYLPAPASNLTWGFAADIKFIHDEPYLAFYREMHYTDFNREYVSRAKAKAYFEKHYKQKKLEEETKALNDKEMLKAVYEMLKDEIDEGTCFVQDRGDCCSPRYEIIVKNTWGIEDGCYRLFDLYEEADATEMKQLWDSAIESCKKRAKKAKCCWYWHSCCSDCIALISADAYDNGFARFKKVDFTNMKDTEEL
jgi:hypothetical protein